MSRNEAISAELRRLADQLDARQPEPVPNGSRERASRTPTAISRPYQDDGGDMIDAVGAGPCERFVASNYKRSAVELRREFWKLFQLLAIAIDEEVIDTGPEEAIVLGYLVDYVGQGSQFAGRQLLTEDAQSSERADASEISGLYNDLDVDSPAAARSAVARIRRERDKAHESAKRLCRAIAPGNFTGDMSDYRDRASEIRSLLVPLEGDVSQHRAALANGDEWPPKENS